MIRIRNISPETIYLNIPNADGTIDEHVVQPYTNSSELTEEQVVKDTYIQGLLAGQRPKAILLMD